MEQVPVTATAAATATLTVDATTTYQTIDGFGGAMTDSAASLIDASAEGDAMLQKLFGTGEGKAGLSIVRTPMGASDLQADDNNTVYTYEDEKGSFTVKPTEGEERKIGVLQDAKAVVGDDFKLISTPWTAPAWAKKSGKILSTCGTDENEFDVNASADYARYFADYVTAYAALGLKPWMVSMQNEPENCKTEMPTTLYSPADEVTLSQALAEELHGDVKVMGWDHNWNDLRFVDTLIDHGDVDYIGYHCYDGTHYATQTDRKPSLMTECSGWTGDGAKDVAANLGWEVANTIMGPLQNGSTGSVYWSLAQHADGTPYLDVDETCTECRGMLTVGEDGSFEPSQDFYFWAQFSAFVRPGAVRVSATQSGDLSTVAFTDGDVTTLVVLNSSSHVDGGAAGTTEDDLRGHMVYWDGEADPDSATTWLIGADGYRRWINDDDGTRQCLSDAGKAGPEAQPGGALDKYINLKDVWAVCGAESMGTRSELETGTYLQSSQGARLTLNGDGVLAATDSAGATTWTVPEAQGSEQESGQTCGQKSGQTHAARASTTVGDRLYLQDDGDLVLFEGFDAVWSTGTGGSGAVTLFIRDDGVFGLSDADGDVVWQSAKDTEPAQEPTPDPTPDPTSSDHPTAQPTTASPAPSETENSADGNSRDRLPRTGTDLIGPALGAIALIAGGTALVAWRRRPSRTATRHNGRKS